MLKQSLGHTLQNISAVAELEPVACMCNLVIVAALHLGVGGARVLKHAQAIQGRPAAVHNNAVTHVRRGVLPFDSINTAQIDGCRCSHPIL